LNLSWKSDVSSQGGQVEDNTQEQEQDMSSLFAPSDSSVHSDDVIDETEIYEDIDTTHVFDDDEEVSDVSHADELSDDSEAFMPSKTVTSMLSDEEDSDGDVEHLEHDPNEWMAARSRRASVLAGSGGSPQSLKTAISTPAGRGGTSKQRVSRGMLSSPSMPNMMHSASAADMHGYALVGTSLHSSGASTPKLDSRQGQMSKQGARLPKNQSAKHLLNRGGATPVQSASAFRRPNFEVAGDSIDLRASGASTAQFSSRTLRDNNSASAAGGDGSILNTSEFDSRESDEENHSLFRAPKLNPTPDLLDEHAGAVSRMRVVTRRKLLLSASVDGTVRIWNSEGGTASRAVLDCTSFTRVSGSNSAKRPSAKVGGESSPRPVRVTSMWTDDACDAVWGGCSDGGVRVWNGGDGKPMRLMKGHEDIVCCIEGAESITSAMADPHMTASGSADKTVRIWDLRAKRSLTCTFRGHGDAVLSLKWIEGGRAVVSGSKDRSVKIWDTRTGRYA
jgi:hypothetical protein